MLLRGEIKDGVPKCRYGIIRCYEKVGNTPLVIHNYLIQSRKCKFLASTYMSTVSYVSTGEGGTEVTSRAHTLTKQAASSHLQPNVSISECGYSAVSPSDFFRGSCKYGLLNARSPNF